MNCLKKSIFRNFIEFAEVNYDYKLNRYNIETDLEEKICDNFLSPNNKMAQKQLDTIILPTISVYQNLILNTYNEQEVIECIKKYVMQYYKSQAKIISFLGKLPFFYTIFKVIFPIAMKMYPTEYWDIEWLSRDNDKIEFNMRDCLYFKTFKKYNCSQLTQIFCEVDNLCYDNMSNEIDFIRTETLGKNGDICDFKFQRRRRRRSRYSTVTKIFNNGNISKVQLKDNTIYRSLKPNSPTIHKLLKHLEAKGISFVPHFLGIDEDGNREILSFVSGNTIEDYPNLTTTEEKLHSISKVAKIIKLYHDATVDFEHSTGDRWYLEYDGYLEKEVICHNDIAPYNMTFLDNIPFGIIDFDTACPAPRIWDIAYSAYRFVPLSNNFFDSKEKRYRNYCKEKDGEERKQLLKGFIAAYGNFTTDDVLENVIKRLQALVELFDIECENGNEAFIKMKEEGHQQLYINDINFIKDNMNDWK